MNRVLDLYNSNEYIQVCVEVVKGFSILSNFITDMRVKGDLHLRNSLIDLYRNIFKKGKLEPFFQFEAERVIKPHYSLFKKYEHDLSDGNSSYHILLKISDHDLLELDRIYQNKLTGLLRIFKNMFSVIDAPEHELTSDTLIKKEEAIRNILDQMNLFLDSIDRRQDIQTRAKLKAEIIQNIPYDGFYHLTHVSNLKSIVDNGILSRNRLLAEERKLHDISNSDIQNKRKRPESIYGRMIHDYVPLYINPKNPFLASSKVRNSIQELVLIEVYPNILVQKEKTLFSDGNAAEQKTNFFGKKDELERVNWSLLQNGTWDEDESKRMMCSEVLIPDSIHRTYIQKVYVSNTEILEEVMKTYLNAGGIKLVVNNNLFSLQNELN